MDGVKYQMVFPTTYGSTRFSGMEDVERLAKQRQPDALGLYGQCRLHGVGVKEDRDAAFDDLFASANAGCSDAILYLGRLYEQGIDFIPRDIDTAICLYKYAYSLENLDALHNLGFVLFSTIPAKRPMGLAMMKLSATFGSNGAKFHLGLIADRTNGVEEMSFYDIPKSEFDFDLSAARAAVTLYQIDLNDFEAIKAGLLDVLTYLGMGSFSEVVSAFRVKYLRGRKYELFQNIPFEAALESLKQEDLIETVFVGDRKNEDRVGVVEDIGYRAKFVVEQSPHLTSQNVTGLLGDLDDSI